MTTIAWDGKSLAADRQTSMFRGACTKVVRLACGHLFGSSGDLRDGVSVQKWLEGGGEKPKVSDSFHAILIEFGTLYVLEENLSRIKYDRPFFAVGSGRDFAMAAMLLGKTARDAVLIAHQLDVNTGADVDELPAESERG